MKLFVLFPKYEFYVGKSTDEKRILLRNINSIIDTYLTETGVDVLYAGEDVAASKFLDKVENKRCVTFISDKSFIDRYNGRLGIIPEEVWQATKDLDPIKMPASNWKAPMREPGQDMETWLRARKDFCVNMCKCNMEQYLSQRGVNVLYIEHSARNNTIPYRSITHKENDGRLMIRINVADFRKEAHMGGIYVDEQTAVQIMKTM